MGRTILTEVTSARTHDPESGFGWAGWKSDDLFRRVLYTLYQSIRQEFLKAEAGCERHEENHKQWNTRRIRARGVLRLRSTSFNAFCSLTMRDSETFEKESAVPFSPRTASLIFIYRSLNQKVKDQRCIFTKFSPPKLYYC